MVPFLSIDLQPDNAAVLVVLSGGRGLLATDSRLLAPPQLHDLTLVLNHGFAHNGCVAIMRARFKLTMDKMPFIVDKTNPRVLGP